MQIALRGRAQRLLRELEPERLDEFEADLDMLSGAVADLRMILDQRRGLRPATCGVRQPRIIGMMCPGGRSRAAPATGSVRIFHTILKAGPAGGRLRRPSSAGRPTVLDPRELPLALADVDVLSYRRRFTELDEDATHQHLCGADERRGRGRRQGRNGRHLCTGLARAGLLQSRPPDEV
jgi:hypothetical protein